MHLLKRIREESKKTQGELAVELGVTQSALSQIEMKNNPPSMKTFLKLIKLGYINEQNIYRIVRELIKQQWG